MKSLGIDIGGTNTKLGLVSSQGELLQSSSFPTAEGKDFSQFLIQLKTEAQNFLTADVQGIGVGVPNLEAGKVVSPPNLNWGTVELVTELEQLFQKKVVAENDADAAAWGEKLWGRGGENFVTITLGTGLGTGLIVNGALVRGSEGGHTVLEPSGRECSCGGTGHLEAYTSVTGIKTTAFEVTRESLLFREIFERYQAHDLSMQKVVEKTAEYLGRGLASMASLLKPEKFILAGGVSSLGKIFCQQVQHYLDAFVFASFRKKIQVEVSDLALERGAVLGAAALVFSPPNEAKQNQTGPK